jgi:tetratricopeptide (TPR) repeat protein
MPSKNTKKGSFFNIDHSLFVCLLIAIAILAVYGQVRNHAFVNFDDGLYVTENRYVKAGLTRQGITWSFTATTASNWHPLTWLSHMLDCQLYGMNPGPHHLTNLFFHIANTLLLLLVLRRMTGDLWPSSFVAAMFALHPLHVESVAWVAERKDVLSTFFWALTIFSYTRYVERPELKRYLLVLVFFILGLMAKPMLVTLPFLLLLLDYWPIRRFQFAQSDGAGKSQQRSHALSLVWEKVPFFVLSAASSFLTFLVQQRARVSLDESPLDDRIANALVSYVSYMGKMIWPYDLAFFYQYPSMVPIWQVAGAGLLVISISFLAVRTVRRLPYLAVGWLWFLGTLVPVIGLVQVGGQAMADRYTYVPLIGLFIMIAWGVPDLLARWRYRKVALALSTAGLLSILMATTWLQVRYWTNDLIFFDHALHVDPNNFGMHNHIGLVLAGQGKTNEAISHYSEALRINPQSGETHNNMGLALAKQGKAAEAISHYNAALRINPHDAGVYNNLGNALIAQRNFDEAIAHYTQALRLRPHSVQAHNNLGNALVAQGRLDEAIAHYTEALRLRPDSVEIHNNLGTALIRKGKINDAIRLFREALRISPDNANAHRNLKKALAAREKIE